MLQRTMRGHAEILYLSSTLLLSCLLAASTHAADPSIPTYRATYEVTYKGRNVGSSEFAVSHDESTGRYTFRSSTRVKGLLRLLAPKPAVEHSEFIVADGEIRPIEFWYEDGTRKGEGNYHTVFDWANATATVDVEGGSREIVLTPGALDRGSLQVALMRDMISGSKIGPYVMADESSLTTYELSAPEADQVETGLGSLAVERYERRREGSSRATVLSVAPALRYLPVRIEQLKNDESNTIFVLDAVEGLQTP